MYADWVIGKTVMRESTKIVGHKNDVLRRRKFRRWFRLNALNRIELLKISS